MKDVIKTMVEHPIATVLIISSIGTALTKVIRGKSSPLFAITVNRGDKAKVEEKDV